MQYISKLVEGAATQQIQQHLCQNSLFPPMQSAYRQFHSTETALLRIKNDLLMAMDRQKVTLLILLDLSAAFDTIVHDILVDKLRNCFGIDGTVLAWIKSYLNDRQQQIKIDDVVSDSFNVSHGVPQGSRLGPLLFTLYTSKLIKIFKKNFPMSHVTATQMTHSYTFLSIQIRKFRKKYQFLRHALSMYVHGCFKINLSLTTAKLNL